MSTDRSYFESVEKALVLTVAVVGVSYIIKSFKKDMIPPVTVKNLAGMTIAATTSILAIDFMVNKGYLPKYIEI